MRNKIKQLELNNILCEEYPEDDNLNSLNIISENIEKHYSGKILKKIPPAKWEAFISILDFLIKENDESIIIKDSMISYGFRNNSILRVHMGELFDGEKINLHISNPKKWTYLFKTLIDKSNNTPVYIIDEENKFVVTNGQIQLFLPKQVENYVKSLIFPNFDETETITSTNISKDTRDKILKLSRGLTYIEFLIQNQQLKSINIPNTAIFILPEFLNDTETKQLNNLTADLTLRSHAFLPYSAENYLLIVGLNKFNDNYFFYSACNSNMMKIEIYEPLDNTSGIEQLF